MIAIKKVYRRFHLPAVTWGQVKTLPQALKTRAHETRRDIGRMRKREPNIFTFIIYGLLFDIVINLWKPFSLKLLERLGGHEFEIALLNALPGLVAAVVLLPGAALLTRFKDKKRATALFILLSRTMLLVLAFVPVMPAAIRPMLFVVLIALMNCPDALSQTSLQSFLGQVFMGNTRAQAITLRNKFGNAIVPLVTIMTGMAITFIPANDNQRMLLYQIFFVVAFLLGLAEVSVFNKFKVAENRPSLSSPEPVKLNRAAIAGILKDKKFRRFFWPMLLFAFTWQAGWPLCGIYQVEYLQANELWFAIIALASGLGAFTSAGFWQKFIRKRGNAAALILSTFLLAVNLLIFPISPNVYVLALLHPFSGFASIGLTSSMLNGVLEATPDENRLVYLAFYNTVMNLSLFVAPMFSHVLLSFTDIYKAFIILTIGRMLASGVIAVINRQNKRAVV